jgi:hypothetical protein
MALANKQMHLAVGSASRRRSITELGSRGVQLSAGFLSCFQICLQ